MGIEKSYGSARFGKRKVLVIEDNDTNRDMLSELLAGEFEVFEAENGLIGLERLDELFNDLSLVLLDVYMPVCDGFEFLRRMRADSRYDTVPVIVATASDALEDEIKCLKLGANDVVRKPYNFEVMMNRVNNIVRLRESAAIVNQLTWDKVTGLYSKEFFFNAAEERIAGSPAIQYDLICSDIENFKSLNDRYGEANCDALLRELAGNVSSALAKKAAGGRIGADVFAFLVEHRPRAWEDTLRHAAESLSLANVNVKFGVVERVDTSLTVPVICNRAVRALETIKGRSDVCVALFDDEIHARQMLEQTIRESMETALGELQFSVFFQPKHDVRSQKTGGAEALVRWYHPEIGFISPSMFIPIFERNGFITKLDLFVWEEACKEVRRCADLGLRPVPISVNASRLDFDMPELPAALAALADRHGIDHALLHVELTESAYSDNPETVTAVLRELKDLGFSTELDDFGAGYSSLVSLNMLPLDVMKLDMSMVRQATALDDYRIVESTIKLAQTLGLRTVVEGVETADEATRVTELGCDLIQGYYYSKPLKRDDFEAYLAKEVA